MRAEILRQPQTENETIGQWYVWGDNASEPLFSTPCLELPYRDNQRGISCIPCGIYICEKVEATANLPYPHIAITNVPNRSGICVHISNYVRQLRGCVAVGKSVDDIDGDGVLDVTSSRATFIKLMAILPNRFNLTIREAGVV